MENLTTEKIREIGADLKNDLSIDQIYDLASDLGGEPIQKQEILICKTICHCGERHKLYYYNNTKLWKCFTECNDTVDIFELVRKVKEKETSQKWGLLRCIIFVAQYFNYDLQIEDKIDNHDEILDDWKILRKRQQIKPKIQRNLELKIYDKKILKHLPHPIIAPWEKEGISRKVIINRGIAFDPKEQGIVIPHYDINNNLIGIRERTLIRENEINGKYKSAVLNKIMYNHPLSLNLYGIEISKEPIRKIKKAIIAEAEKSSMLYGSYYGEENNICVACCGSIISKQQIQLLLSLGVEEICIAFDRQFKEIGDKEWEGLIKKLENINLKYSQFVTISFIFDKWEYLPYKASPLDMGGDIFMKLYKERIFL